MKKPILTLLFIGLISVLATTYIMSRKSNLDNKPAEAVMQKTETVATTTATTSPRLYQVSLLKDHAEPHELLVNVGDSIQFNSKDGLTHNIAQGTGNDIGQKHEHDEGVESGNFGPDEGYKIQISKVGTYYFHDHTHPEITVIVAVYDPTVK